MIVIRTAEAFARLLATHPDTELKQLLQAHAARLAEYADYDLAELGLFVIVEPGDELEAIDTALGWALLDSAGTFSRPVELLARHRGWYEVTFILSDNGFGLVLFVSTAAASKLLAACERGEQR